MSRVKGIISTRRLLRRVPDAVKQELAQVMTSAGPELTNLMRGRAPHGATGRLAEGLNWKFYASSLKLVVGFIGKRVNERLFYARILEFGRKAQTVSVSRRRRGAQKLTRNKRAEDIVAVYRLKVRPLQPRRFVYSKTGNVRAVMRRRLNGIWDRVLTKLAGGGDE